MKDLAREAVEGALRSAGVEKKALEAVAVGNAMAGLLTGQECIRGQIVLRDMGIGGVPVINAENACASAATAFHLAWLYVASGLYDVVMAVGMEKLFHEDKQKSFAALGSAIDVELMQQTLAKMDETTKGQGDGAGKSRSMFMDFYAEFARDHMRKYGTTKEHYAKIAAKNHTHGSLILCAISNAAYDGRRWPLHDRGPAYPMMCSPLAMARQRLSSPVEMWRKSYRNQSMLEPQCSVLERSGSDDPEHRTCRAQSI
jgi:hypothetical protein